MNIDTRTDGAHSSRRSISPEAQEHDDRTETEMLDHKQWGYVRLKQYFSGNHLEDLFRTYIEKAHHGYLSTCVSVLAMLFVVHFCIVLAVNNWNMSVQYVIADLVVYACIAVLSTLALYVLEKYIKNKAPLSTISLSVLMILTFANLFVPFFHMSQNEVLFRPAYTTISIIGCYIFFICSSHVHALFLGFFVSGCYIGITLGLQWQEVSKAGGLFFCDLVYILCLNGFGFYFRLASEIIKRVSLLDRRVLVESTLKLEFEKAQWEQLVTSIIPAHAVGELKKRLQEVEVTNKNRRKSRPPDPWKFDIRQHDNVTILYADIVNYTKMTTTLKSLELVETLHELFGRFDEASEELKVLRVKFLGDCYYCVAGLRPKRVIKHAEACVDLGIRMIKIIQDVRQTTNLPINMRIGIHTGNILSGVIGNRKWQFDIWSKDVSIANRMETTGQPGKVHITGQTKELLIKHYNIVPSPAGETDKILRENHIQTYLITAEEEPTASPQSQQNGAVPAGTNRAEAGPSSPPALLNRDSTLARPSDSQHRRIMRTSASVSLLGNAGRRRTGANERTRRTAFMDSNIQRYSERLEQTNRTMKKTVDQLSFTKLNQFCKMTTRINPWMMTFTDCKSELKFFKQADHIFKYYINGIILVLACIMVIQNISRPDYNRPIGYTLLVVLILILPITWAHMTREFMHKLPKLQVPLQYFQNISDKIVSNIIFRTILYLLIWFGSAGTVIYDMIGCEYFRGSSNMTLIFRSILSFGRSSNNESDSIVCTKPWHMTEMMSLVLIVNFMFLRMHPLMKLLSALTICIVYSVLLLKFDDDYFNESSFNTMNHAVLPVVSHIIHISFLAFTLHAVDRQTDFMTRLDHLLNIEQAIKNREAEKLQETNRMLINNILPIHVASHYLNMDRESGLYYEEYSASKPVAVMFAAIILPETDYMDETYLKRMNARIGDFDKILGNYGNQIEKIKIANWTYMAACGLEPGKQDSEFGKEGVEREDVVVLQLLKFAAQILKHKHDTFDTDPTLGWDNLANPDLDDQVSELRIGISHGEVTAGVVGSSKPLYDIWGDAVNMASRMESNGLVGRIQITENTATVAERLGIVCEYRGKIRVKGKDYEVPVYWVEVNPDGSLVMVGQESKEPPTSATRPSKSRRGP